MSIDEGLFDKVAERELHGLEKTLGDMDPDEVEVDFALDVMTLTLSDGNRIVINSHRAARQIWMAAFRRAWHFSPVEENGVWTWRTAHDELHATLSTVLSEHLGRAISV